MGGDTTTLALVAGGITVASAIVAIAMINNNNGKNDSKNNNNNNNTDDNNDNNNNNNNNNNPTATSSENYTVDKREVYVYKAAGNGHIRAADSQSIAEQLGGTLATLDQLQYAFTKGAQWCNWAWAYDTANNRIVSANVMQEIITDKPQVCGHIGINTNMNTSFSDITVFGVKPPKTSGCTTGESISCVLPFSSYKHVWSQFDI